MVIRHPLTNIPKHPWKGFGNLRFSCFASGPFCWHTVLMCYKWYLKLAINWKANTYPKIPDQKVSKSQGGTSSFYYPQLAPYTSMYTTTMYCIVHYIYIWFIWNSEINKPARILKLLCVRISSFTTYTEIPFD